jgi:hypothetical protein
MSARAGAEAATFEPSSRLHPRHPGGSLAHLHELPPQVLHPAVRHFKLAGCSRRASCKSFGPVFPLRCGPRHGHRQVCMHPSCMHDTGELTSIHPTDAQRRVSSASWDSHIRRINSVRSLIPYCSLLPSSQLTSSFCFVLHTFDHYNTQSSSSLLRLTFRLTTFTCTRKSLFK